MARKPRNVDLGPLYLQVGEEDALDGLAPSVSGTGADATDVTHFESLLHRGRGHRQEHEVPAESPVNPLLPAEPQHLADADDICGEVAHLWVGTGLQSAREVRVGLRDALLPDTSVRLHESEGCLCIEFTCGKHRVADWLDRKLPLLTRELGQRLNRPLEVTVFMGDGSLVGTRAWPEDGQ